MALTRFTICCLLPLLLEVQGARILAVLPTAARSHHRFFQPLMATLAGAGHDVTVYSPFPLEQPIQNYTEVILDNVEIESDKKTNFILELISQPHHKCGDIFHILAEDWFREFLESEKISELLNSKMHFDLIITEAFFYQEYTLILGHIFKAPVIALQAFFTHNVVNYFMGNDLHQSYIPYVCGPFSNKMSFLERMYNTLLSLKRLFYIYHQIHLSQMEVMMRERFPDMPPLMEMVHNISLVFVNDHLTADYAQPRTPNILPVAGIHIPAPKPLPEDLKVFMDEASDGVILFSLGTYIPDQLQPKEYFDMFIKVFQNLPQRVLWKTRKEDVEGLPVNVKTVKWLPQRDVLAHPNCVLFITHGGLLSQHEAVHSMVPVVAIPQFGDQHRNARFYEERGIGLRVLPGHLTEVTLSTSIREVLNNPRYKDKMKRLSVVFRDRPVSPHQAVVYWTEYVLRHGGGHLRPAASLLHWYQRSLLDVLAVSLAVLIAAAAALFWVTGKLINGIRKQRGGDVTKKIN